MTHCCGRPMGRLHVLSLALVVAILVGYASGASAQMVRGVTDTEIVIGTIADLSGSVHRGREQHSSHPHGV
jgi:hypothetical protein